MKNILFPTDFSDAADHARSVAFDICERYGLTLYIMHSLNVTQKYLSMSMANSGDPSVPGFEPEIMLETIEKDKKKANEELEALKKKAEAKGIKTETRLKTGNMHDDVLDVQEEDKIDFVVMGTHGASGFKEAVIGSNAEKVVRNSRVPVLTIKKKPNKFDIKKIVFASDFIEEDINEQIPKVQGLAQFFSAGLDVVYINTPTYFEQTHRSMERMKNVLEKYEVSFADCCVFNDYNIEDGIINYADYVDADMVILITHGFKGLKKLFNDNITEAVVNAAERPVISINARGKA